MTTWIKPEVISLAPYMGRYVDLVPAGDLTELLEKNGKAVVALVSGFTGEQQHFCYAPGKWSVSRLLVHMMDAERIFAYRILCIARGDKTALPGFDENCYAENSYADERDFKDILEEYLNVRKATISLLKSLNDKLLSNTGTTNNNPVSVRAICYMLAGHEIHHINVIKEKYLK